MNETQPACALDEQQLTEAHGGMLGHLGYGVAFWSGVAGHLAGGGSVGDIPWQEIRDASIDFY